MTLLELRDKLLHAWRWGLRPGSAEALWFAFGCVVLASGIHFAFRLIRPDLAAYSTYYAAVFFATIVGGVVAETGPQLVNGLPERVTLFTADSELPVANLAVPPAPRMLAASFTSASRMRR